jgi:hypothetical protein
MMDKSEEHEQHWHRTPPLFVVIVNRHLIHSHIHFHLCSPVFFVYYYRKINCATNLHHLTSLLSLEKVDICIFLERPLKEALAFKGRNSSFNVFMIY